MKKLTKTAIALALTITASFAGINKANANDETGQGSSILLASGTESHFENFMQKNGKTFLIRKNNEWTTFNQTIALYNNLTGRYLNLSEEEKEEFLNASAEIKAKLTKMKAQDWLDKVNVTEKVFTFIWDQKMPATDVIELPLIESEVSYSR